MKPNKSVEILSIFGVSSPASHPAQTRSPPQKRKAPLLKTFWRRFCACISSNQLRHVVWLMVASQCFQIARVANFPTCSHSIVASQWTGIQHSQCLQRRMLFLEQR